MKKPILTLVVILTTFCLSLSAFAAERLPIIDVHSQFDHFVDKKQLLHQLNKADVDRVILSARGKIKPGQLVKFARTSKGRIIPAVRTKGQAYADNKPGYYKLLKAQLKMPDYRAMAEIILWHAAKGNKAPEWRVPVGSPQVQAALKAAYKKGWPAVIHYEFRAAGWNRDDDMAEMEALVSAKPDHSFVLIHMGQLGHAEASRLLAKHPNLHFIPSWSNSITRQIGQQPWVNLFDGEQIAPDWRALMVQYPGRFILGFDNVYKDHWTDLYGRQVALWRKALQELPSGVAHAVAHKNAERLWKLEPL